MNSIKQSIYLYAVNLKGTYVLIENYGWPLLRLAVQFTSIGLI